MRISTESKRQAIVGLGVLGLGFGMGVGAWFIPSEAGYAGVGPNFLPWVVAVALLVLGALLVQQALTGGFEGLQDQAPVKPCNAGFVWVSAGLLINALVITSVGFVVACGLCFMLSAQGLRRSMRLDSAPSPSWRGLCLQLGQDVLMGIAISAPVYWMFTQLLAITLPGLTSTGWM